MEGQYSLLIVALVIAAIYGAYRYFFGAPSPMLDKVVGFVVAVLVFAWFLCFIGVWCPGQKVG